jgi:hypothetical protein
MMTEETRNMNRSNDRLDERIARHWQRDTATDEAVAANVLKALNAPLPRQRHSLFDRWPSLLLNRDFAPAWPRLAALACIALFGCVVGLAAPTMQRSALASVRIADADGSALAFDTEPMTGARP